MKTARLDFQEIHDLFRPKIWRYLARLVGQQDAEDLAQEVFIKVSQALDTFRGESELSTWLYRIATNAATDRLRTRSFRQSAKTVSLDDASEAGNELLRLGENGAPPEQLLMRLERYQCYADFVGRLPPNYRTVLVLSELEQLTNEEISTVLGLSLDVVKIRLHRGRARLLQDLKAHCRPEDWL